MGSHPLNLALRFILELIAVFSVGYWGWTMNSGWVKYGSVVGLPIILMVIWVTFNVPGDPSRSGNAPVVVPGFIRLLIELAIFAAAIIALYKSGNITWSWIFGLIVLLHYAISYDRIIWLLGK